MAEFWELLASDTIPVTRGSDNVFVDLGFDEIEAQALQIKADLTRHISTCIYARGLTQKQAGALLGISQPDVSKLMHSRYTGFSVDRLLALLNALEVDVEVVLHPRHDDGTPQRGTVRVVEAATVTSATDV